MIEYVTVASCIFRNTSENENPDKVTRTCSPSTVNKRRSEMKLILSTVMSYVLLGQGWDIPQRGVMDECEAMAE
jgi:hypothetical protein